MLFVSVVLVLKFKYEGAPTWFDSWFFFLSKLRFLSCSLGEDNFQ